MEEMWIASSNRGKVRELRRLVAEHIPLPLEIHSQSELPFYSSPQETGTSFEVNARIKARSLQAIKRTCWVMADDSGLEVEGLNHLPGVHSARYAGQRATDVENTIKLLKMIQLRCPTHRQAQFRCVIVAYSHTGTEYVVEGTLRGHISAKMQGAHGFGYDNVFIPEGQKHTLAEINVSEKNRISHRSIALCQLAEKIMAERNLS